MVSLAHSAYPAVELPIFKHVEGNILPSVTSLVSLNSLAGPLCISGSRSSDTAHGGSNVLPFMTHFSSPIAFSPSFEKEGRMYGWNTSLLGLCPSHRAISPFFSFGRLLRPAQGGGESIRLTPPTGDLQIATFVAFYDPPEQR